MPAIYDKIGSSYGRTRQADERIVGRIVELLGLPPGARILDIGAGTGNYSLALADLGFKVTALEPSTVMSEQAPEHPLVEWIKGEAESLPFDSCTFDAAILILCVHHFSDLVSSLREVQRVTKAGPILLFTYDPSAINEPWLFEYFPAFRTQIRDAFPTTAEIASCFDPRFSVDEHRFPLPHDLSDAFAGAGWRHPEKYLERNFRDGTSAFRQLDPSTTNRCLARLREDLETGRWDRKYSSIRTLTEYDHGYLFILAKREQASGREIPVQPETK